MKLNEALMSLGMPLSNVELLVNIEGKETKVNGLTLANDNGWDHHNDFIVGFQQGEESDEGSVKAIGILKGKELFAITDLVWVD